MAKPLSKSKIVSHMAEKVGTSKKVAAQFFEELFKLAVKEAKGGAGKFVIPNIGRVVKAHRKARMGRNPQTGEAIKIKAKTVVRLPRRKSPQGRDSRLVRELFANRIFNGNVRAGCIAVVPNPLRRLTGRGATCRFTQHHS